MPLIFISYSVHSDQTHVNERSYKDEETSLSLSLSLSLLLLAGCDLLTGGTGDDTATGDNGITSPSQILGTWKQVDTDSAGDQYITQYTFNSNGTFIELSSYTSSGSTYYHASKGNYSLNTTDGTLSMTTTHYGLNVQSFSAEGIEWIAEDYPDTETQSVLLIGDQLYWGDFIIAQGPISGIVGTWVKEANDIEWDYDQGKYVTDYYKYEWNFTNDEIFTYKKYSSTTGTYGLPVANKSGLYTYANGTLTLKINENNDSDYDDAGETSTVNVYIYNNKYLIAGSKTSATAYAFFKQ